MKKIFILIVLVAICFANAVQARDVTNNELFELKARYQFKFGAATQIDYYPLIILSDSWAISGIASWKASVYWPRTGLKLAQQLQEISLGLKESYGGMYIWPLVGVRFAHNNEQSICTQVSLYGGIDGLLGEVNMENTFDDPADNSSELNPQESKHRLWVQFGSKEHWRFRIGAMGEIQTTYNHEPLVMAGPMFSFFFFKKDIWPADMRLDFYAGRVINDNRPDNSTPATFRFWLWTGI